eukprot:1615966-Pleurochrysis_carterae.AAC.1
MEHAASRRRCEDWEWRRRQPVGAVKTGNGEDGKPSQRTHGRAPMKASAPSTTSRASMSVAPSPIITTCAHGEGPHGRRQKMQHFAPRCDHPVQST